MNHNQNGSSALLFGLLVVGVFIAAFAGWRVYETRLNAQANNGTINATLTGTVTEGPTAPVCKADEPCVRAVSNHTIEALDTSGNIVATDKTNINGQYSLKLRPGHYTMILVPKIGMGDAASHQVDVRTGLNTYNLSDDTGIR